MTKAFAYSKFPSPCNAGFRCLIPIFCLLSAILFAVPSVSFAYGGGQKSGDKDKKIMTDVPALPKVSAKQAAAEAKSLFLKINGEPVYTAEYRAYLEIVHPDLLKAGKPLNIASVDQFINNRLITRQAEKEGVASEPRVRAVVETRVNKLWRDVYWAYFAPTIKVSEKELRARIPAGLKEVVKIQQLIVNDKDLAMGLRARALKGEDFDKLVRENSTGLSAKGGGIVDGLGRDDSRYNKVAIERLFTMKVGDITDVTELQIGFAVIKLLGKKSVKDMEDAYLAANRREFTSAIQIEAWKSELGRLESTHSITVDNAVLDEYVKAIKEKKSYEHLLKKVVCAIDNVPFTLDVLVDPSGMGVLHGDNPMLLVVGKRFEEYAIAKEVERLGLVVKNPAIGLRAKVLRENVIARQYVTYRSKDLKVSDKDVRDYFDVNRAGMLIPKSYSISFVETKSEKRVNSAYELLAKGVSFGEVVDKWSDDKVSAKSSAGRLLDRDISPEFAAIRSMKKGEYLKSPAKRVGKDGVVRYYIIRLDDVAEERSVKFEDANRADMEKGVFAHRREAIIVGILEELRKTNKIEFAEGYDSIKKDLEKILNKDKNKKQGGKKK